MRSGARRWGSLSVAGLAIAALAVVWRTLPAERTPFADPRLVGLRMLAPGWSREQVEAAAAATDRLPPDVRGSVADRLAAVVVTEQEARAFHDENLDLFGGRAFEVSRRNAETLLKVHRVRRDLGLVDPEVGIAWPDDPPRPSPP